MKRNILFSVLMLITTFNASYAGFNRKNMKVFSYGLVSAGAYISFCYWFPRTLEVIKLYGFSKALQAGFVQRVVLDGATILVCYAAINDLEDE